MILGLIILKLKHEDIMWRNWKNYLSDRYSNMVSN